MTRRVREFGARALFKDVQSTALIANGRMHCNSLPTEKVLNIHCHLSVHGEMQGRQGSKNSVGSLNSSLNPRGRLLKVIWIRLDDIFNDL